MGTAIDPISRPGSQLQLSVGSHMHGPVTDQIEGLITVYKDGHVERPPIIQCVSSSLDLVGFGVLSCHDIVIDSFTNLWVRLYVPVKHQAELPLVVYFHGGGFCVGSAAWSCYHLFLSKLALKAEVVVVSVNYRLAPENPLPAAYEDGFKTLKWIKQQSLLSPTTNTNTWRWWWTTRCDFSNVFLAGDSAGANIAQYLAGRLEAMVLRPLEFKGTILIQPFFGGQARTESERSMAEEERSPLSLAAADTYWRLALPPGADRDHPWCNPLTGNSERSESLRLRSTMVCISERDVLRDRNLDFCGVLEKAAAAGEVVVEKLVYKDVGHAFQILGKSEIAIARAEEMISDIEAFMNMSILL